LVAGLRLGPAEIDESVDRLRAHLQRTVEQGDRPIEIAALATQNAEHVQRIELTGVG
jgi:hypothetical protein